MQPDATASSPRGSLSRSLRGTATSLGLGRIMDSVGMAPAAHDVTATCDAPAKPAAFPEGHPHSPTNQAEITIEPTTSTATPIRVIT